MKPESLSLSAFGPFGGTVSVDFSAFASQPALPHRRADRRGQDVAAGRHLLRALRNGARRPQPDRHLPALRPRRTRDADRGQLHLLPGFQALPGDPRPGAGATEEARQRNGAGGIERPPRGPGGRGRGACAPASPSRWTPRCRRCWDSAASSSSRCCSCRRASSASSSSPARTRRRPCWRSSSGPRSTGRGGRAEGAQVAPGADGA